MYTSFTNANEKLTDIFTTMEPTRQESISRQSSILKPPKQRQPLQCVAPNPGSSENSPTIKIKRRVSFAKNRRIKEFCDEPEAVCDDTYEEHDLSNTKSSSASNSDHPLIISVPCEDKENFPVQLFSQNDELNCKEVPTNVPSAQDEDLSECDMEMDNTINNYIPSSAELQNKQLQCSNTTIYCDDGMEMTTYVPSDIIPCRPLAESTHQINQLAVNTVSNSTDLTQAISTILGIGNSNQINKVDVNNAGNSTDLTQAISTILGVGSSNKVVNRETEVEDTNNFHKETMEFTSALPSSTWIRPNNDTENLSCKTMEFTSAISPPILSNENVRAREKTDIYSNTTMEITEAVPVDINFKTVTKHIEKVQHETIQDKTNIFYNKSMEITEAVQMINCFNKSDKSIGNIECITHTEKTKIFTNKSMEISQTVPISTNCQKNLAIVSQGTSQNKEPIPFDKSTMEMTEAIGNVKNIDHPKTSEKMNTNKILQDRTENTRIFLNKSMEISETIPVYKEKQLFDDNTKYFTNKSMEITELTRCIKEQFGNTHEHKNHLFNMSMEMTKAVPSSAKATVQSTQKIKSTLQSSQNRSNCFNNKSMEMTEVTFSNTETLATNNQSTQMLEPEKTKIFNNISMEMTKALDTLNNIYKPIFDEKNMQAEEEKTNIFHSQSMEITKAVPTLSYQHKIVSNDKNMASILEQNKTNIFDDKSMEMTESFPTLKKDGPSILNSEKDQEKTNIFINKSMEMTEAIPAFSSIRPYNISREFEEQKTNIFVNKSMEITEAVPSINNVNQYTTRVLKILSDKSIVANEPMESRKAFEAFSNANQCKSITEKLLSEQENTNIFANKSMELTEAVSVYKTDYQSLQKEKITFNKKPLNTMQDNMALDLPLKLLSQQTNEEQLDQYEKDKTEIFSNKSMNVSETMPVNGVSAKSNSGERTNMFFDTSMDMTGVVLIDPLVPCESSGLLGNINEEQTKNFVNLPMDITEAVPIHRTLHPDQHKMSAVPIGKSPLQQHYPLISNITVDDKTKMFNNKSMDITEAVCGKQKVFPEPENYTDINKPSDIFLNKSMDFTEAVVSNNKFSLPISSKIQPDERTQLFHNSMELTSKLPIMPTIAKSYPVEDEKLIQDKNTEHKRPVFEGTRVYHDESMEITSGVDFSDSVRKDFPPDYRVNKESDITKPLKLLSTQKDVMNVSCKSVNDRTELLPTNVVQTSISLSNNFNKESDIMDRLSGKDESFHRLTSDELNTLCASMNLPTHKYTREESTTNQQNFLSVCNDVNVLRDSLKNNTLFQKTPLVAAQDYSGRDRTYQNTLQFYDNIGKGTYVRDQNQHQRGEIENNFSCTEKPQQNPQEMQCDFNVESNRSGNHLSGLVSQTSSIAMEIEKPADLIYPQSQMLSSSIKVYHDGMRNSDLDMQSSKTRENINDGGYKVSTTKNFEEINVNTDLNISVTHGSPSNLLISLHSNIDVPDENNFSKTLKISNDQEKKDVIQVYHDMSNEQTTASSSLTNTQRKLNKMNLTGNKNDGVASKTVFGDSSKNVLENFATNKSEELSKETTLSRMPSDSTEVLIATMGFKTKLPHPLIINDKTIVTISNRSSTSETHLNPNLTLENRTETNKTYIVNRSNENLNTLLKKCATDQSIKDIENELLNKESKVQNFDYSRVGSQAELNDVQECEGLNNEEEKEQMSTQPLLQNNEEGLDEIQPPSFLCSDSMQEDVPEPLDIRNDCLELLKDKSIEKSKTADLSENDKRIELLPPEEVNEVLLPSPQTIENAVNDLKRTSDGNISSPNGKIVKKIKKATKKKHVKKTKKVELVFDKEVEEVTVLTPFLQMTENLKTHEKRDDCIWNIRDINQKYVAVDFITNSFVVVVRLNEFDKACIKDIQNVELISRLRADSKNTLLKIVHKLLLEKFNPVEILEKFKLYEDVLPLLDYLSEEVKFMINFMLELKKINAMNLSSINDERILFMVSSRKTNIIVKVSVAIKTFTNIGQEDIDVTCILGEVKETDLKQLIVNIKKDYKFLSRYISDIKNYITLMEESTCSNKF